VAVFSSSSSFSPLSSQKSLLRLLLVFAEKTLYVSLSEIITLSFKAPFNQSPKRKEFNTKSKFNKLSKETPPKPSG